VNTDRPCRLAELVERLPEQLREGRETSRLAADDRERAWETGFPSSAYRSPKVSRPNVT